MVARHESNTLFSASQNNFSRVDQGILTVGARLIHSENRPRRKQRPDWHCLLRRHLAFSGSPIFSTLIACQQPKREAGGVRALSR